MVAVNDDSRGTYNTNSQIKFKTAMPSLCKYRDGYILIKGTQQQPPITTTKR